MNKLKRGLFIVFEGLDRSGKTTQVKKLQDYFATASLPEENKKVKLMRFPDRSTELGKTIDAYLKNEIKLTDQEIHELFAKNRWERKDTILSDLLEGTHIIVDRYAFSGAAYSSAKGLDLEWCKSHDKGLPRPDIVFYINISENEIAKRSGFGEEKYEKLDFQRVVREKYGELYDKSYWISIDGSLNQEDMNKEITKLLTNYIESFYQREDVEIKELW